MGHVITRTVTELYAANFCFAENFKKMIATFKQPFSNVTREKIKAVKKFVPWNRFIICNSEGFYLVSIVTRALYAILSLSELNEFTVEAIYRKLLGCIL